MIQLQDINKIYENQYALKNINLSIDDGECVILKGISGSGKSTLLSIISGITKPTSGSIVVNNEQIAKLPDKYISQFRSRHFGFIYQSFNLIDSFSVRENIYAPLVITNDCNESIDTKIIDIMQKCNISHKQDTIASVLSGGEKQRCAIARALVNNPSIILADEPTANLDKANALVFLDFVRQFYTEKKCVIISTHDDIFDTLDIPKRVVYIQDGQIVC